MNYIRQNWFKIGFVLAIILGAVIFLYHDSFSSFRLLLIISFITLLLHQFEEYQFPGHFPQMINRVVFKSKTPNNYPLNTNSALIINIGIGWTTYISAIIFAEHAVWLAIASILVSAGNFVAHTFLFNIKGKSFYNPGMFTAIILFLPITIYFFIFLTQEDLLQVSTLVLGLILGIIINYFGILRLIPILAKKNNFYTFK